MAEIFQFRNTRPKFAKAEVSWNWIQHAPRKMRKAFRENLGKIQEFLDSLPEPDATVVGMEAENGVICLGCLTAAEKLGMEDGAALTRDEADETAYFCDRCKKKL